MSTEPRQPHSTGWRVRPFRDADYDAYAAVRNAAHSQLASTGDGLRRFDRYLADRGADVLRLVAEDQAGVMVAYGQVVRTEPGGVRYLLDIGVAPAFRRRGVGASLWARLFAEMTTRGARLVRTNLLRDPSPEARAFLAARGFAEVERAILLVRDLARPDGVAVAEADDRLARTGVRITTLAAEGPRDAAVLDAVYALHNACRRTQPPVEDHATPVPRAAWDSEMIDAPTAIAEAFFLAEKDGSYVGLGTLHTATHHQREEPGVLRIGFLGALPDHQFDGTVPALGWAAIGHARHRGAREIRIGCNDTDPVLPVCERLRFERRAVSVRFGRLLA